MLEIIYSIIGSFVLTVTILYASSVMFEEKIKFDRPRNLLIIVIIGSAIIINYEYTSLLIRPLLAFLLILLFNKIMFKRLLAKTLIITFFIFALILVAEIIVSFFFIPIVGEESLSVEGSHFMKLICNTAVSSVIYILININAIKVKLNNLIIWVENRKEVILHILIASTIIIVSILYMQTGVISDINFDFFLHIGIIVTFFALNILLIKEKKDNGQLLNRYDELLEHVKAYENLLEEQRILNHENKNQLVVIDSMAENNKELKKYIKSLLKDYCSNERNLLNELAYLPKGGMRGLINYKIIEMRNNNIDVYVEISKNILEFDFNNIDTELYRKICNALGIFLDNAKDAVIECEKKSVGIEIYVKDEKLYFTIYNNYLGKLEIEKFGNHGYSTKGKGRGYGLSLVKEIILENKKISQAREIINDFYIQHLIISS